MAAAPEVVEELMTDSIKTYIEAISNKENMKPELTDNGKLILDYFQKSEVTLLKAKDVAEGLFISSKAASGSLRKLVNDGFCEKVGQDPVVYTLTEKGKNFIIEN